MTKNLTWHTYSAHSMTSETLRFAQNIVTITLQGTNTHQSLLHNDDSSLSALEKGGWEEGSFGVTPW